MSRYKVIKVVKVEPPQGAVSKRWYQYVIGNEINTIISTRSGTEKEIRKIAADSVKRLNEKYLTNCKTKNFNCPVYESSFSGYL